MRRNVLQGKKKMDDGKQTEDNTVCAGESRRSTSLHFIQITSHSSAN